MGEPQGTIGGFIERLARLQERGRSLALLLLLAATTVAASLLVASRLELKTGFDELLPRSKESVLIADRLTERLGTTSLLIVVAEGSDDQGLERFVDAATPELAKIDPKLLTRVDKGVHETLRFFADNRFLYAPLDLVQQVHDEILERYDYEVLRRTGAVLDDEPPPITEATIRRRIEERPKKDGPSAGPVYPDGYYLDRATHTIAILLRTPIPSGDIDRARALELAVRRAIDAVEPKRFDPTIRVGLTGDVIVSAEEHAQIRADLSQIGLWGVSLILGAVLLFYLRFRTLLAMALTVGIGTSWTFALAYFAIGYFNTSSGLLLSIVVGNGINFGIIYMARYVEARRLESVGEALRTAHRDTWLATLAAAAAAATAYGSLGVTDFRGFKHFGIIGGSGMLLCWVATYLFLPAILVLSERILPLRPGRLDRLRALYGRPFAFLVTRAPRLVALLGLGVGAGAAVLAFLYVKGDPIEYDLYNIRNAPARAPSEARRLSRLVAQFVSRQERTGLAIVTDSLDQVKPLEAALEALRDRDGLPPDEQPFAEVITIYDLLPSDQEAKAKLVNEVVARMEGAHAKHFIGEEEYRKVRDYLPPQPLGALEIRDLPEQVARPFQERDGTRGTLVYVVPTPGRSVWDAHYLVQFADAVRATELPDHTVVKGSNSQVVFADMFLAMLADAPKAIVVSLFSTVLLVLVAFRARRGALWVLGSLALGVACMLAALSLWPAPGGSAAGHGLKINFLNFIALPITIGVGADYAINIVQRHRLERDAVGVVRATGGAVVLCSLTTILGYLALTLSVNQAVKSFGIAAALGEASCVVAAVLVLPAALRWVDLSRRKPKP